MRRIFQSFVDHLIESRDLDDFRLTMAEATAALDLSCFAYIALQSKRGTRPLLLSSYPSRWTSHYIQQQYHQFDPVILHALQKPEPFEWGLGAGLEPDSESARELFDEAAQFGIRCGFTIPVHDSRGGLAAVTFAADQRGSSFRRSIRRYARMLPLMAMNFHAHASRKLHASDQVDGVSLSSREIECLNWAAQGKSAWEIGCIMGLSRYTVTFHLDNAKAKLGVRSTIQAVARLAAAGRTI